MSDQSITMYRGDDLRFEVFVKKKSAVVDVTGWRFWFTVKASVADPDPGLFQTDTTDGSGNITIAAPTAGQVAVKMPSAVTQTFGDEPVTLLFDVQGKDPLGNRTTVLRGTITVLADITRAT